jgi:ribonuclease R
LKNRIGDDFEATVTGIEEWGIYVSIKDPIAEGLVRFRDIVGEDFYVFNPDQGLAFGKKSGRTFRRGDIVKVRLLRVDPLRGQADFSIIEKISSEPKKKRRQGERDNYRDVHERADRAAAAEALGYVSQPEDDFAGDDFESEYVPMKRNRQQRRKAMFGGKPGRNEDSESGRGRGRGKKTPRTRKR